MAIKEKSIDSETPSRIEKGIQMPPRRGTMEYAYTIYPELSEAEIGDSVLDVGCLSALAAERDYICGEKLFEVRHAENITVPPYCAYRIWRTE